jgi:vacuolar-type H+-ATPase catalytic subunit A/Vma1
MKRTIVVANPANAPPAAREASVHTGLAIAEYLRDQGCDVALTVDSLCRWSHAIGSSTRQQQQPQLGHWDRDGVGRQQLEGQLGAMYERAGRFVCAGAPAREGTITLVAITADSGLSRPGGGAWADVDTITEAAKAVAQTVWAADRSTPFMSIDWRQSRSNLFFGALTGEDHDNYYRRHIADDFVELRRACLDLLRAEADLAPRVAQVGRDGLTEPEQVTLYAARLVREDFLHQNFFSSAEARCSLYKAAWMMRNMVLLRSLAQATLAANANKNKNKNKNENEMKMMKMKKYTTWRELREAVGDLLYRASTAKYEEFDDGHKFVELGAELREAFAGLGCPIFLPSV